MIPFYVTKGAIFLWKCFNYTPFEPRMFARQTVQIAFSTNFQLDQFLDKIGQEMQFSFLWLIPFSRLC